LAIKIPNKIRIFARTYDVQFINNLSYDKNCSGEIAYREQVIRLQPSSESAPRHHEDIEISFFHELLHGVLYELNYPDLRDDEGFIDRISQVIYAALRDAGMLVSKED
jgi:hypothetical protein